VRVVVVVVCRPTKALGNGELRGLSTASASGGDGPHLASTFLRDSGLLLFVFVPVLPALFRNSFIHPGISSPRCEAAEKIWCSVDSIGAATTTITTTTTTTTTTMSYNHRDETHRDVPSF
jgi:hypothetical protein